VKSRQELLRESAGNPQGMAEYAFQLQEQLRVQEQALGQKEQLLAATHQELARQEQLLAEARAYIAELKRQLFGPTADKLSPQQEEQLRQLTGDLCQQAQRPAPLSQEVLEQELPPKDQEKLPREARRQARHPLPVQLEVRQVVLEPEDKVCGHCHQQGRRIGPGNHHRIRIPSGHPQGDVFLEFCGSRGREGPEKRLADFKGTIQTDAYAVYDSLRQQRPATLKRLGCLAHIRRKWYKAAEESCAEAVWFIGQIRQLYLMEDETRNLSHPERKAVRGQKAPALWRAMKRRALELRANPRLPPRSSLGKAVSYFLNEYTAVVGYLRDGRFEIDNNLVENDVRPSVVGRKRWLFIGHPQAGWRSAVIYTIIQSCRRRRINPQEYLTDVPGRLPSMKNHEVKDVLPSRWKPCPARPAQARRLRWRSRLGPYGTGLDAYGRLWLCLGA
jgi:predicted DNA-binding transcriptional regulator AlpA